MPEDAQHAIAEIRDLKRISADVASLIERLPNYKFGKIAKLYDASYNALDAYLSFTQEFTAYAASRINEIVGISSDDESPQLFTPEEIEYILTQLNTAINLNEEKEENTILYFQKTKP